MKSKQNMKKQSNEIRNVSTSFELSESRTIVGKAICFESPSNDLGFIETIKRGAVTEDLLLKSDVFAKMNHSDDYILARSKNGNGSLLLEIRDDGLYYMFDAPNTEKGNELLEHIKRNEINTSSFAFSVADEPDAEKWYKKDGIIYRDIYKIGGLFDVSPVFREAYSETKCSLRASNIDQEANEIEAKMNLYKTEIENL